MSRGWPTHDHEFAFLMSALSLDFPEQLSVYLGALGMTGMTAWSGLNLVDVKTVTSFLFREPQEPLAMWPGNWRNCADVA